MKKSTVLVVDRVATVVEHRPESHVGKSQTMKTPTLLVVDLGAIVAEHLVGHRSKNHYGTRV